MPHSKKCLLCWTNQIGSQKMTGAYKMLSFSISKTNHLNAHDQEGNQPVFSIYIGHQFCNHCLM